jgi:uncharacterized protein
MKLNFCLTRLGFVVFISLLLAGCLFRRTTESTRHFILTPMSTNQPTPAATQHLPVAIGLVKMPPYVQRNYVGVRNSANEIEYFEDALWAERLDQGFQRTLAANLSTLLPSDKVYIADWGRGQAMARVSINVQQFDVDSRGHGTLIVQWQITGPGSRTPAKSGQARLTRTGAPPGNNPEIVAMTLSDLVAEFSRELAQPLRESAKSSP